MCGRIFAHACETCVKDDTVSKVAGFNNNLNYLKRWSIKLRRKSTPLTKEEKENIALLRQLKIQNHRKDRRKIENGPWWRIY